MTILKIFAIIKTYCFTVTVTNSSSDTLITMFTVIINASSLDRAIRKFNTDVNIVETAGISYDISVEQI